MVFSFQKIIHPILRLKNKLMGIKPPPIVVVCGATGTGKSKLAIQLARAFSGEVINADALQLYEGLNISTNKATIDEMQGVRHHLMGILDPMKFDNNVHDFRKLALPLIDEIRSRNVMPILVGGTFYYIEALLWDFLIETCSPDNFLELYKDTSNEDLHAILRSLDPKAALRLHPNNRRKVLRAIEIADSSSVSVVDHLSAQHKTIRSKGGSPRYPPGEVLILWVHCERSILVPRLFDRVDSMLNAGLLQELEAFHADYNTFYSHRSDIDRYTQGVFQSIGFKEFHNYLILKDEDKHSTSGQKLLNECVKLLKIANRKYAKRQLNWLTNRFLRRIPEEYIPVYKLDATESDQWQNKVLQPACDLIDHLLNGSSKNPIIQPESALEVEPVAHVHKVCDDCNGRIFVTEKQWHLHLTSRKHARCVAGLKRKAKLLGDSNKSVQSDQPKCSKMGN